MIYALVFSAGFIIGMIAAAWWFGDTSARLIAHLSMRYGFPLPTKDDLAAMSKIPVRRNVR